MAASSQHRTPYRTAGGYTHSIAATTSTAPSHNATSSNSSANAYSASYRSSPSAHPLLQQQKRYSAAASSPLTQPSHTESDTSNMSHNTPSYHPTPVRSAFAGHHSGNAVDTTQPHYPTHEPLRVSSLLSSPAPAPATVRRPLSSSGVYTAAAPTLHSAPAPSTEQTHHHRSQHERHDSSVERRLFASELAARRASLQLRSQHASPLKQQLEESVTNLNSTLNTSYIPQLQQQQHHVNQSQRPQSQQQQQHYSAPIRATPLRQPQPTTINHEPGSPVEQHLHSIISEKERELQELMNYRTTHQQQEKHQNDDNVINHLQQELNTSLRLNTDRDTKLHQLQQQVIELSHWKRDKLLHIDELERRIQHMHDLVADKDRETVSFIEERQRLEEKFDKRVDKLKREHAVEIEAIRVEFEQHRDQLFADIRQREAEDQSKQEEMRQVLQSSEQTFSDRKRIFAEHEAKLQAQVASYAQNALAQEREMSLLRQTKSDLQAQVSEVQSFATELEVAYKEVTTTLDQERSEFTMTNQHLTQQLQHATHDREQLLDNYEQKVGELVQQLHAVDSEIAALNAKHQTELEQTVKHSEETTAEKVAAVQAEYEDKLRDAEQQLHTVEEELNQHNAVRNELQHQLEEAHQQVQTANARISDLETKYNGAIEKVQQVQQQVNERETELGHNVAEIASLKQREKDASRRLNELRDTSKRELEQQTQHWQQRQHDMSERIKRLERELHDKSLALQAEQSRTSELTALVTTLRSVTAETARLKTMEQQQMLNDFSGNISSVKSELHRISQGGSGSERTPNDRENTSSNLPEKSPRPSTSQSNGSKTVRMKPVSAEQIQQLQQNGQLSTRRDAVSPNGMVLVGQTPRV